MVDFSDRTKELLARKNHKWKRGSNVKPQNIPLGDETTRLALCLWLVSGKCHVF